MKDYVIVFSNGSYLQEKKRTNYTLYGSTEKIESATKFEMTEALELKNKLEHTYGFKGLIVSLWINSDNCKDINAIVKTNNTESVEKVEVNEMLLSITKAASSFLSEIEKITETMEKYKSEIRDIKEKAENLLDENNKEEAQNISEMTSLYKQLNDIFIQN